MCLALLIDGVVELGLLVCPNLGVERYGSEEGGGEKGVVFLARKGEGSWSVSG